MAKTGRTLTELAQELERQTATRRDYIAPQGKVEAVIVDDARKRIDTGRGNDIALSGFNGDALTLTPHAHGQMAGVLNIPKPYYDRMLDEQPALLAENINTWLRADPENKRMIRTLDGRVRAVLSPRYRPLDNFDLAQVALPALVERRAQVVSAELTETRMYIKAILPDLSDELPAGQTWGVGHNAVDRGSVCAAIVISNSEIGAGTLRVEPSVFTASCTNLMIRKAAAMKKYHVGRAHDVDQGFEVFRDETREADDRAFFMKVRDVTVAAFNEDSFRAAIAEIKRSAEQKIMVDDLPKVVEMAVKELALPERTSGGILTHLARGGDLTAWGLSSAITRVANDTEDYEDATVLERAGGEVIALPRSSWERISTAGASRQELVTA